MRSVLVLIVSFMLFSWVPAAEAQVSYEASMISTVQTDPELAAGEELIFSVWLLDAAGRLQDQVSQDVYVWLEEEAAPGLMSPALAGGDPYVHFKVNGSLYEHGLVVTIPGRYRLHASLFAPDPVRLAEGTQLELHNPDLHPILVNPGAPLPARAHYSLQTDLPAPFTINIPRGEPGLGIRMTLEHRAGLAIPPNSPVVLSSPDGKLEILPEKLETGQEGEIVFRLISREPGSTSLRLKTDRSQQDIPVAVVAREALFRINSSRVLLSGGEAYLDAVPVVMHGRSYIPLRSLAEAFGGSVDYANGAMTIALGERSVQMQLGQGNYFLNGQAHTMDAAPYLNADAYRTMIPARFAAEGLGLRITPQYNAEGLVEAVLVEE